MQASFLLAFLSLVAISLAISVTSPSQGTTWSSSGSNTITWTRVNTDPDNCAVTLVQQGVYKQTLADNVATSTGHLTVTSTLPVGNTFQVNLVKSAQDVNSILAQSAQFNITQGSVGPTSTSGGITTGSATTAARAGTSDLPNVSSSAAVPPRSTSSAAVLLRWCHGRLLLSALAAAAVASS